MWVGEVRENKTIIAFSASINTYKGTCTHTYRHMYTHPSTHAHTLAQAHTHAHVPNTSIQMSDYIEITARANWQSLRGRGSEKPLEESSISPPWGQRGGATHTHTHTHTRTHTHMNIHKRTHAHARTNTHTHMHMHKHTQKHTHANM